MYMVNELVNVNSGREVEVGFDPKFKNIGLKISGGADSAIVGYMLCKFIMNNSLEKDTTIIPITINQVGKAFQVEHSIIIMNFYNKVFPEVRFGKHYTAISQVESRDYIITQKRLTEKLESSRIIDCLFVGVTANPPLKELSKFGLIEGKYPPYREYEMMRDTVNRFKYSPLTNSHKQDVAALYNHYDLLDTLFPLTRSCESYNMNITENMTEHCG